MSTLRNRFVRKLDSTYLRKIINIHFNKEDGSLYWINKERELEICSVKEIKSFEDFKHHYAFKNRREMAIYESDLRFKKLEEFIPGKITKKSEWIWASETGGTTGIAKRGTWGNLYWKDILNFSNEFLDLHKVPTNENWLFVGPTGPHTTGRLMISISENRRGMIFCVDMDPRIVRIYLQEQNENAVSRYLQHIWEQVEPIIKHQDIGVLFCTASLLEQLPQYIDLNLFKNIKAVVHAGLSMSRDTHRFWREDILKHKPLVGIYGTSVSGISYQKPYEEEDDYRMIYIPSQPYIVLEVIDENGNVVDYNKEGDIRCFRFTEDSLIPGFIERDKAHRIKPFGRYASIFDWDWISDPHSPETLSGQKIRGVY